MSFDYVISLTEGVASTYWGPLFLVLASSGIAFVTIVAGTLLRPKSPSATKNEMYECGNHPSGDAQDRIPMRYYTVAMLFLLFDAEVIFLWPWAVAYRAEGALFLIEAIIFVAIVGFGYVYAWSKGAFEWKSL